MSTRVPLDLPAPDFNLTDTKGQTVRLSDFRNKQPLVLYFLRGFM